MHVETMTAELAGWCKLPHTEHGSDRQVPALDAAVDQQSAVQAEVRGAERMHGGRAATAPAVP